MIIAISDKVGSGKDTIGSIIRYLDYKKHYFKFDKDVLTFQEFQKAEKSNTTYLGKPHSNWQIKKFADKLKDIVCLLIGCTREQLEDSEFKNKELGEEWVQYGYADGFDFQYRNGNESKIMNVILCDKEKYKQERAINWQTTYKNELTPRLLLRLIETNLFRDKLLPNIWVNALMNDYYYENGITEDGNNVIIAEHNWIITDLRFPNEFKAVKERGGICIRVNRNDYIFDNEGKRIVPNKHYVNISTVQHYSETTLDSAEFDFVIDNDGSIEELIEKVEEILIKLNLI